MTDLVTRSGRCHGPGCDQKISDRDPDPFFCDEKCQARWNGQHEPSFEEMITGLLEAALSSDASAEAECVGCGWRTEGTGREVIAAIAEHAKQQHRPPWWRRRRWWWSR